MIFVLLLGAGSKQKPVEFVSKASRVRLIELFSSEGCSSCPPADRWFSGLRSHGRLWTGIVPVAYHVTYWDYIGWKDRLASKAYSARQRAYAKSWKEWRVYTPGFVVDGNEWKHGFRSRALPEIDKMNPGGGILKAVVSGRRVQISFSKKGMYRAHAALLGFGIKTKVRAGENKGKTLRHDFVALGTVSAKLKHGKAEFILPRPSVKAPEYGIAVWVVRFHDYRPVQAVGGYLPRTETSRSTRTGRK
ncbi:MAG: DUF1223 domain-containing protein [Elusimicrobia bacterium]|nr:MAG: DUF1223 domain-containing protein [Elusimicrobiota bacterium]